MSNTGHPKVFLYRCNGGFTLVELMVAMVLGLFLVAVVFSLFVANKQAYRTNENLARIQEAARVTNELMSREIREAGGNLCGTPLVANVLNGAVTTWWANWDAGAVQGFDGDDDSAPKAFGTGPTFSSGERVAGTDAIIVRSAALLDGVVITAHNPSSAQFTLNTTGHGLSSDDVVMVCDYMTAAIMQVTNANSSSSTIVHNTGTSAPGNCSKGLGYPTECTAIGNTKEFKEGFLSKLTASFWYVGHDGQGGTSLYRMGVDGAPGVVNQPVEVVENVADMQIEYLTRDGTTLGSDYVSAEDIDDWTNAAADLVVAVRLRLTLKGEENVGTGRDKLQRFLLYSVSLRNREIVE